MPDNSMTEYETPTPRDMPLPDKPFGIMRAIDGHLSPDEDDTSETDRSNPHEIGAYNTNLLVVILLIVIVGILLIAFF